MARRLRDEVEAAFPVVEAILVAILVFGAILFVGLTRRPTVDLNAGGEDLEQVAADAMRILEAAQPGGKDLDTWLGEVVAGNTATANDVDAYLQGLLGPGVFYMLRLDNGYGKLPLVPVDADEADPIGAHSAHLAIVPSGWFESRDPIVACPILVAECPYDIFRPGDDLDVAATCTVRGPNGFNGPEASWSTQWGVAPSGATEIPEWAPLGWWQLTGAACPLGNPYNFRVLGTHTRAYHPPQGLELVVWTGA